MAMYVNARAIIERTTADGLEVLLQIRDRAGEAEKWELPGGRIEEYESFIDALYREVREETGLTVTEVLGETDRVVWHAHGVQAELECLRPFFLYQTLKGPVDTLGAYFRCHAEGELTTEGDGAKGHRWVGINDLRQSFADNPEAFDWLSQAAIHYYLHWLDQAAAG